MTTEEEAREAADEKEVQGEAMDLEPFHRQTNLDSKLSSMEIKNEGKIIDSTDALKIPEDQVLVEAPSEINVPPEHNLNSTASSLNGQMDEENKISNKQLHEHNKKDHEQVEAPLDAENTIQNNKVNNEVYDCSSHGESTTEDSSLLKHEKEEEPKGDDQQDEDPIQDTLKTDKNVDQSQIVVDQLDHNLDLAKTIEDTQPASMANIPDVEVVAESHAGVQSSLDSDAILDTIDGSTEKDELARDDSVIHLEHRESFSENTSTAKHTDEEVKAGDQQSKQDGAMGAEDTPKSEQEDIPKCEETDVSEATPKSEHVDESTLVSQEVLHQEPSEETNGPAYEKKEQSSQQSSMATSDDTISEHDATICEPPIDIQVHNKESLEEMEDAEVVDTKAEMQQSCAAFEEAVPECHVATTKQDSVETNNTEISETHNTKTASTFEDDKVENNVTARGPTTGSHEVDNAGSTEEIMENIAENVVLASNVSTIDEANKENNALRVEDAAEKHMREIEPEVTNSEPVKTDEDSDQRHVSVLDDSAQEDNTPVSQNQQMESSLEINETEATRTEAVSEESNASVSEEPSPEEYIIESKTTSDAKEVNTTESLEAIEGDKDTQTREISNQSNMDSAGKSTQENNAPESETTTDIQPEQELESKEMDTELVQVNEISREINATIFHEQTQENNPTTSELHVMESEGGVGNIVATEEQATPQQLARGHSEEKATEGIITSSEPQALESVEKMNVIDANKPQSIPQQSIVSSSEESDPEEISKEVILADEPDDGHQQLQDPELAELNEIETNKSQEIVPSSIVSNYEEPNSEDNVTVIEQNPETQAENLQSAEVMEDTENVKGHDAFAGEADQEENAETEANIDISSVQEPELEEAKNIEPVGTDDNIASSDLTAESMEKIIVEIESIPHKSPVTSITEVSDNDILIATAPHADIQPVLEQESVEDKCTTTTEKPRETHQIIVSASDELTPTDDNTTMAEPARDTPLQNVIAQGIKDNEDAQTDQFSNPDSFHIPEEAAEETKLPRIEQTSDVPEIQQLGSTEETRGNKAVETEDHQQPMVSTPEEPAVDNNPNVDDDHVHKEKLAELKDNEAVKAEQVLEKSTISTLDNAPGERSELRNDPNCCVQPALQVESSRDSEESKILKVEETSDQQFITLEDTMTEDIVADEIDPPVGMEQEHQLESVEEVKDISANKAKQDFHSSQPDALNKPASESITTITEPTKETKSTEGINDGDISCEQTELATSVDLSGKDNEIAPQEHIVEPHEENLGNKTSNAMLAKGTKDELQTPAEHKDDAFDLGETAPAITSKKAVDEDAIQSSGEDTVETSKRTDQNKEGHNDETKHNSSQKSSEHYVENITHVQDKDINGEPDTERGTAEASQALIENDAQKSKYVTEKYDKIKSGEQANDQKQSSDVEHQPQTCESSVEDDTVQKVSLDERHKEDEEVETQKQQLLADEQEHEDESNDVGNEPLEESESTENGTTNRTEVSDALEDPIDVPYNAESGEHEDKACTNKVNDDLLVIQSAEEIVAGTQENKEIQKEEKAVHSESQTKAEEEDMSQLRGKEPYNLDIKMDDTAHAAEIIHENATAQPREIEEWGGEKGLNSIYKAVVETTEQNNVEQDFSIHHKAEDEKQESTEDNAVELEAMQQKVTSNVEANNDDQLPISRSLAKHVSESADDVRQLEIEGNAFAKVDECEKTEAGNKSIPETVTFNDEICDKVTGAEGGLSDGGPETFDDTRRNLDASPEEQENDQIIKEQDEEDMHKPDFGDDQKEVEQDLPVSNFLMNLILGKENNDANGHSELEAETKQEATSDENNCLTIPKQDGNLSLAPTENHKEDKKSIEQEKNDVKCSEETHEVVEEQSHDLKLGTETSLETEAKLNKNPHHLELPPYQDKMQDDFSNEVLSEEAAETFTKIEAKDIAIPSIKHNDEKVGPVCQENTEVATQIKNESLNNDFDDLNNTKASEEDTVGEGHTGLVPESLNDNGSVNAVFQQTLLLTESGITDGKGLPSETDSVQNPVCEMQDKTIESSTIGATSIPDTRVENEEDKTDEKQSATIATGEVAKEHVEISNDNPQKSIGPEATSFEQQPQITKKVSYTEKALGNEKEISEGSSSTFMDKKEDSNVSVKGVDSIQTGVEIQADNSNTQINQDKQEAADNKTETESEKLEESNIQEQQENGTEQKSPKESKEEDQKFLAKKETLMKEEDVDETVRSHTEIVNIKSNDEQELSDSKVQERDLNVFSPKDVRESEESFVEITKPEFSTDEEQSPKADEMDMSGQKTYEGKTKGEEKIKNFTDEEMKTEAPAAEQKAVHKKQNLLSGVGSKVKHQLAKVKKAITGKPGRTKPESPK